MKILLFISKCKLSLTQVNYSTYHCIITFKKLLQYPYSWWLTVIILLSLHTLSPPPGQEYTTFSDREVQALNEHYCCQPQLCMVDGNWRDHWPCRFCVVGTEWVTLWDKNKYSMLMMSWLQCLFLPHICFYRRLFRSPHKINLS